MSNRFGKSHVDGDSVWVYKVKVPNEHTRKSDILLRWTPNDARDIAKALENDDNHFGIDQRNRSYEISREAVIIHKDEKLTDPYAYTHDLMPHELTLTDDWGTGSWQQMLVHLKTWIG
jgi:hypothetical protein